MYYNHFFFVTNCSITVINMPINSWHSLLIFEITVYKQENDTFDPSPKVSEKTQWLRLPLPKKNKQTKYLKTERIKGPFRITDSCCLFSAQGSLVFLPPLPLISFCVSLFLLICSCHHTCPHHPTLQLQVSPTVGRPSRTRKLPRPPWTCACDLWALSRAAMFV